MKTVRFERHEGLGQIVLANPPKNLIATHFTNCLREAVHEASDSDIRALLDRQLAARPPVPNNPHRSRAVRSRAKVSPFRASHSQT